MTLTPPRNAGADADAALLTVLLVLVHLVLLMLLTTHPTPRALRIKSFAVHVCLASFQPVRILTVRSVFGKYLRIGIVGRTTNITEQRTESPDI